MLGSNAYGWAGRGAQQRGGGVGQRPVVGSHVTPPKVQPGPAVRPVHTGGAFSRPTPTYAGNQITNEITGQSFQPAPVGPSGNQITNGISGLTSFVRPEGNHIQNGFTGDTEGVTPKPDPARTGMAGYFFTPFSGTLWGRRWQDAQGVWHETLGAKPPGQGATYLDPKYVPAKWTMPGFDGSIPKGPDGKPISPKDAAYFLNASGLKYKLNNALNADQMQMDKLTAQYNGQTMFDQLNEERLDSWDDKKNSQFANLAARGFYNSGTRGHAARNLAEENSMGHLGLRQQWGDLKREEVRDHMTQSRHDVGNEMLQYLLTAMQNKQQLGLLETLGGR